MKKFIISGLLVVIYISIHAQENINPRVRPARTDYQALYKITDEQLVAGNPITLLPPRGRNITTLIINIYLNYRTGATLLEGTGTDSTLIYMNINGVKRNIIDISADFFKSDNEWNISGDGPTKKNTAIIIDPADFLSNGSNGILTIVVYYKIDEN